MRHAVNLRANDRGSATVEMAIALPVLVAIIYGIFQAALLLLASAGMQHGIGEGARLATIYPTPASATITTKVTNSLFGMQDAQTGYPQVSVAKDASATQQWYTIAVSYRKDVSFLFLPSRTVTINHSKRVYIAQ